MSDKKLIENKKANVKLLPVSSLRKIRKINPLGMRVVVQIKKSSNKTETGLFLPEGSKDDTQDSLLGTVIEVATANDEDNDEANISGIPLGKTVLIPKDAGIKVPWSEELRIVETADVLAIVSEVSLS